MWSFCFSCSIPAPPPAASHVHHQHNTINTTPSTHPHQHNAINTSPKTQHHQHTTPSTQHHKSPSPHHHQHSTINTHHHQHITIHTTQSKRSTSGLFCLAGAALGASPARFAWQAQHSEHLRLVFVWQGLHLEHRKLVLRGRCSTWNTFIEVRGGLAKSDAFWRCLIFRGIRHTWSN